MDYTKPPWNGSTHRILSDGKVVMSIGDYERAVACVNACNNITKNALNGGIVGECLEYKYPHSTTKLIGIYEDLLRKKG